MAEKRLVLSDASPLIELAAAGGFDLLRELFGTVTVTRTVRKEVAAGKGLPGARELASAIRAGWVRVIKDVVPGETLTDLDAGEASTLSAAVESKVECLVLMDDPIGRRYAKESGVAVTGTAGILLIAKKRGLLKAVRPFFETLAKTSDFRLSAEVVKIVLAEAGES